LAGFFLWAKVSPLSAKDLIAAQAAQSQVVARLKIRHRTDIDSSMRVVFRGETYAIDSPALNDDETGNIYSTFLLSKGVKSLRRLDGKFFYLARSAASD
jgi:SPP1 family predicted phage head-tail adaptor